MSFMSLCTRQNHLDGLPDLAPGFRVVPARAEMAERLAEIQRRCFPTLSPDHLITPAHYRAQIEKFPEGQHVVIDADGRPVAASGDLRVNIDFGHIEHRYVDIVDHNWLGTHDRAGEWLYGFDISVDPDCRGRGLARLLYAARQALAKHLNLKGHVAGGMMRGYPAYKDKMDAATYAAKVAAGEIDDPVLTVQLKQGFRIAGVIDNYLDDPACDNKAAFIVWDNPDYRPEDTP